MQTVQVSLSAGVWYESNIPRSTFFTLAETESALTVELSEGQGYRAESAENVESGYRVMVKPGGAPIGYVRMYSATAQTVRFGYSYSGREIDNKKVTSTVAVVDGSKEISIRGDSYSAFISQPAVVGEYSHLQLFNPAGSGRVLIVNDLSAYHYYAGEVGIHWERWNTALANLDLVFGGVNKNLSDSGLGVAERRIEARATTLGASTDVLRYSVRSQYELDDFKLVEPVVLPPGSGLVVRLSGTNMAIAGTFQYHEVDE